MQEIITEFIKQKKKNLHLIKASGIIKQRRTKRGRKKKKTKQNKTKLKMPPNSDSILFVLLILLLFTELAENGW